MRDSIGKKYIPGSREGMYMITEAAYTPVTYSSTISGRKAFQKDMAEGVKLLNSIQDVYLDSSITIA